MTDTTNKPCVLVVDDAIENIDVLAMTLEQDYEVKVALNGEDALEIAFKKPHPDIVLLDILMPGMDGYQVCQKLKENEATQDIPVVFVTVMGDMEDEEKGFDLGGVDYITKPIRTPIVRARVKAHLELKMAREHLKEQNQILQDNLRLREDVECIIRHDLKTPINVVMWAPDILMNAGNLTESQTETLTVLKQASYSMLKIINSSINLIKMERGEYQVETHRVNVLKPLFQVINEMRGLMRTRDLTLAVFLNGSEPQEFDKFTIEGENILIYSIFANLIKNALEASPKGKRVTVSLDEEKDFFIRIHNHGAVDESIRDRFFDKYITNKKNAGTGLGTYSARLITETLNGAIQLDTSEEKGTTITISFPGTK